MRIYKLDSLSYVSSNYLHNIYEDSFYPYLNSLTHLKMFPSFSDITQLAGKSLRYSRYEMKDTN
jgi:hypothetical protein